MIDLIKNQRLLSFILFLVYLLIIMLAAQWSLTEAQYEIQVYSPFKQIFNHFFYDMLSLKPWLIFIVKLGLVVWQAALINQVFRGQFLNQQHWLTFIIYCLSILIFHDLSKGLDCFLVSLVFVYIVKVLLEIPGKRKPYREVFDVFFLNSIVVLLEPGCFVFYAFLSLIILLFRPFNIYEFLIGFSGLLIPFVWVFSYYFIFEKMYLLNDFYLSFISEYNFYIHFEPDVLLIYFFIIIGVVLNFVYVQNKFFKISVKNRIYFTLQFWLIFFCLVYFFISINKSQNDLLLLSIPLAFIMSPVLLSLNRRVMADLYIIFLLLCSIEIKLDFI